MGQSKKWKNKSKQQRSRSSKTVGAAPASVGDNRGKIAWLIVVGILALATVVVGMIRQRNGQSVAAAPGPNPGLQTQPPGKSPSNVADHEHAGPAQLMMGGDPSKELVPASGAVTAAGQKSTETKVSTPEVPGFGGMIALDPVCETVERPSKPFPPGNPAPSTRRMAERLADIRDAMAPSRANYLNDRLAETLQGQMTNTTDLSEKFRLQFQLAIQQVNAARPDAALNTFSAMERMVAEHGGQLDDRTRAELRLRKGMAFYRLGEQENCLATHNADSCIFPLTPKAQHLLPRGSRGAIAMFAAHLAEYPNDHATRWLLNLAHMTLGEYPDKVDSQFLIPPERFASEYQLPR